MDYYCEVCLKIIKTKNKYKHCKSKSHIEFDKCKDIILSHKDNDVNDVDEAFHLYIIEHNKKFDSYLMKCEFDVVFNYNQYCPYVTSKLLDNKAMVPWKIFLKRLIDDFKDKGYTFNQIAEILCITKAKKLDMSYDFYIKHNMHAIEGKLNALINKNKSLINKINRDWRNPLNRKFESYRVWLFNQIKIHSNLSQIHIG